MKEVRCTSNGTYKHHQNNIQHTHCYNENRYFLKIFSLHHHALPNIIKKSISSCPPSQAKIRIERILFGNTIVLRHFWILINLKQHTIITKKATLSATFSPSCTVYFRPDATICLYNLYIKDIYRVIIMAGNTFNQERSKYYGCENCKCIGSH